MDPVRNPYARGAGTPPPELAGRNDLIESVRIITERVRLGRSSKSKLLVGLRGVGKTVLLDRMRDDAEAAGMHTVRVEAPENRSLPAMLAPQLQEWGKHAWDTATTSPITLDDVQRASRTAIAALDESFFRVRLDRLTPLERRYLRAMAELGSGPHRSGDIAVVLRRPVTALGPTRAQLISKGMIWSPGHGDSAFTVPLFDEFMRRIMPGGDWAE